MGLLTNSIYFPSNDVTAKLRKEDMSFVFFPPHRDRGLKGKQNNATGAGRGNAGRNRMSDRRGPPPVNSYVFFWILFCFVGYVCACVFTHLCFIFVFFCVCRLKSSTKSFTNVKSFEYKY